MKRQMITALVLAALTAGVVYAQHVNTDSDPAAPFATYKTYAWTPGTASAVSLTEQRIHDGVNAQLQGKGMTGRLEPQCLRRLACHDSYCASGHRGRLRSLGVRRRHGDRADVHGGLADRGSV